MSGILVNRSKILALGRLWFERDRAIIMENDWEAWRAYANYSCWTRVQKKDMEYGGHKVECDFSWRP